MGRILLVALALLALSGCTRMRFVIDAVSAEDELTETEVMRDDRAGGGAPKVVLLDVTGLIVDVRRPGLLSPGENPVGRLVESLRKAADDGRVKAVIVRINSPGGTVTASDVMYREIVDFKERTGKPVVVLMADVAASGGYYVACAADEIIAYPTTVTGSIGVIIQTFNFSEGMRKIGISADAITSGPNKALGSPFQPMPPEQRALLQELVDEFYDNFLHVVTESRPEIPGGSLKWITDGRVISGKKAADVGVVDSVGDLRSAFVAARNRAGVDRARLVMYHRPLEYVGSAYARAPGTDPGSQVNLVQLNMAELPLESPGFYYLWVP